MQEAEEVLHCHGAVRALTYRSCCPAGYAPTSTCACAEAELWWEGRRAPNLMRARCGTAARTMARSVRRPWLRGDGDLHPARASGRVDEAATDTRLVRQVSSHQRSIAGPPWISRVPSARHGWGPSFPGRARGHRRIRRDLLEILGRATPVTGAAVLEHRCRLTRRGLPIREIHEIGCPHQPPDADMWPWSRAVAISTSAQRRGRTDARVGLDDLPPTASGLATGSDQAAPGCCFVDQEIVTAVDAASSVPRQGKSAVRAVVSSAVGGAGTASRARAPDHSVHAEVTPVSLSWLLVDEAVTVDHPGRPANSPVLFSRLSETSLACRGTKSVGFLPPETLIAGDVLAEAATLRDTPLVELYLVWETPCAEGISPGLSKRHPSAEGCHSGDGIEGSAIFDAGIPGESDYAGAVPGRRPRHKYLRPEAICLARTGLPGSNDTDLDAVEAETDHAGRDGTVPDPTGLDLAAADGHHT